MLQEGCGQHRGTAEAYLYDSPLRDHSQLCVRGAVGVLLHTQDPEAEGALELWMGHMGLLHPEPCRCKHARREQPSVHCSENGPVRPAAS